MSNLPISETDLQAYVDAALPEARRDQIEDYLADQPEEAERVKAYLAQKKALRALFNPVLDEPLPENLRALAFPPQRFVLESPTKTFLSRWSLQRFAASVLIALASGLAGW